MQATLNILGAGKLARTLARLWHQQRSFALQQCYSRRYQSARQCCDFAGAGRAISTLDDFDTADVWLLATPDRAIAETAQQLAAQRLVRPGDIVFHCSGVQTAQSLQPLQSAGAHTASVHPLHSFADPAASIRSFAGSYCTAEGQAAALQRLLPAFESIDARIVTIEASAKPLYHAGSVIACNYLVALLEASLQSFAAAQIPRRMAAQMLLPIVHNTVDNALGGSPEQALTGPIARGDVDTVATQLAQLQAAAPQLLALYRTLGLQTVAIAARQNAASDTALRQLEALLKKDPPADEN